MAQLKLDRKTEILIMISVLLILLCGGFVLVQYVNINIKFRCWILHIYSLGSTPDTFPSPKILENTKNVSHDPVT